MHLGGLVMASTNYKLGTYIELREVTNANFTFGPDDVRGVNNLKLLMPTKADINGRDLSKFQIVCPGDFVFNHRTCLLYTSSSNQRLSLSLSRLRCHCSNSLMTVSQTCLSV